MARFLGGGVGSPRGLLPEAPTDPDVRISRIRLRRVDYSTATQDSLPAAGQPYRAGLVTRRVPTERFQVIPSSFPRLRLAHPFQSIEITAENWLPAEPDITATALMKRLRGQLPNVFPTARNCVHATTTPTSLLF
jgi:hypothetical protein